MEGACRPLLAPVVGWWPLEPLLAALGAAGGEEKAARSAAPGHFTRVSRSDSKYETKTPAPEWI